MEQAQGHPLLERLSQQEKFDDENQVVKELLSLKSASTIPEESVYMVGLFGMCYNIFNTSNTHWIVPYIRDLKSKDKYMHIAVLNVLAGQTQYIELDHWIIEDIQYIKSQIDSMDDRVNYCKIISNLTQNYRRIKQPNWLIDELRELSTFDNDQMIMSTNLGLMVILQADPHFEVNDWIWESINRLKNSSILDKSHVYAGMVEGMALNYSVPIDFVNNELRILVKNVDPQI